MDRHSLIYAVNVDTHKKTAKAKKALLSITKGEENNVEL